MTQATGKGVLACVEAANDEFVRSLFRHRSRREVECAPVWGSNHEEIFS